MSHEQAKTSEYEAPEVVDYGDLVELTDALVAEHQADQLAQLGEDTAAAA